MDKIKNNREISFLFVIIVCLYIITSITGCSDKLKKENILNNNNTVALIAKSFEDESFGDISKRGVEKGAEKFSLNSIYEELDESSESEGVIRKVCAKSDLIIFIGSPYQDIVKKMAREKRIKNFVIVDCVIDEPNVKSITYNHEEGGFLMGIIAGNETKTKKVGYVGGKDDEDGIKFLTGYACGVKTVNKGLEEDLVNRENVRFVEGYQNEEKAYKEAKALYENGCDIIFHTAGKSGLGVFRAAKELNKKAIGVDNDQGETIKEYKDVIISSMMKYVNKALYNVTGDFVEGKFKSGLMNKSEFGLANGGIDYAPSTSKHVSKDTMKKLKYYKEKVKSGEIEVPNRLFEVIEFKA